MVSAKKALEHAGLDKEKNKEAFEKLDKTRSGVLIGSGMGGLTVFQDGVKNMVEKGPKKISPFFIPYAITNMWAPGCCCVRCLHLKGCHADRLFHAQTSLKPKRS